MATQTKLTIKRGKTAKDVTVSSGTTISGGDAMELNIDTTKMAKADAMNLLDELRRYILEHKWLI